MCATVSTDLIVMTPPNQLHSEQNRRTDGTKAACESKQASVRVDDHFTYDTKIVSYKVSEVSAQRNGAPERPCKDNQVSSIHTVSWGQHGDSATRAPIHSLVHSRLF
jgi:hypothetical protein